jgi:hypothetical protein
VRLCLSSPRPSKITTNLNMYGQPGSQRPMHPSSAVSRPSFQDNQLRETQGGYGLTQEGPTPPDAVSQSETYGDDVFGVGPTGSAAMYSRESVSREVRVRRCSTVVYVNAHLISRSPPPSSPSVPRPATPLNSVKVPMTGVVHYDG